MRSRTNLLILLCFVGAFLVAYYVISRPDSAAPADVAVSIPEQTGPRMVLSSNPFPLTMGAGQLLVSLYDESGNPIDDARVTVSGSAMKHPSVPVVGSATSGTGGQYTLRTTWPMVGYWLADVTAILPGDAGTLHEQYEVYVFAVPPQGITTSDTTYHSVRDIQAVTNRNPTREKVIVIRPGTQDELRQGHGELFDNIRLRLGGQDTLVIRNDDITDHTVGPFFVRSGETVRQTFSEPAEFVGVCSISDIGTISIIIEG